MINAKLGTGYCKILTESKAKKKKKSSAREAKLEHASIVSRQRPPTIPSTIIVVCV